MKFRNVFPKMKNALEGSNSNLNCFVFLCVFLSLITLTNCSENFLEKNQLDFTYYHTTQVIFLLVIKLPKAGFAFEIKHTITLLFKKTIFKLNNKINHFSK